MKKNPCISRTFTFRLPLETMPAVLNPKGISQFLVELADILRIDYGHAVLGLTGDLEQKCVFVTFKYYTSADSFSTLWFTSRAKVLAEMGRSNFVVSDDDLPF